jgi:hypothetical protein
MRPNLIQYHGLVRLPIECLIRRVYLRPVAPIENKYSYSWLLKAELSKEVLLQIPNLGVASLLGESLACPRAGRGKVMGNDAVLWTRVFRFNSAGPPYTVLEPVVQDTCQLCVGAVF